MLAYTPPRQQNVHIELRYNVAESTNVMGSSRKVFPLPFSYYMLNDIYTNEEQKIRCESFADGITTFDFKLDHPLYDYINHGGDIKIPFYVEPGDSLIINLAKSGKVLSYKHKDGSGVKNEKLLRHDFSNNILYTEAEFNEDKAGGRFPDFVSRISKRMEIVVDSINRVADRYSFTSTERRIAINNAKLQFGTWILEFAPYKSMEINNYSSSHKGGWQALPAQDQTFDDLQDIKNYAFMRQLPMNDSTCLASRYFQQFIISYEHTYFLNYDQYKYYGTSAHDQALMDSAYIAKDKLITGASQPSFFMDIAMFRKHFEAPKIDDGSIKLNEVQVIGHQNDYNKDITTEEMVKWKDNYSPDLLEQLSSPSYWLMYKKKYKNKKRAKELIKKIEEEEERDKAEHDAMMKAYEEEMKRQKGE